MILHCLSAVFLLSLFEIHRLFCRLQSGSALIFWPTVLSFSQLTFICPSVYPSRRLPGVMSQQMQNLQLSQTRKCPGGPASPSAAKRLYRNLSEKLRGSTSSFEDAYFFGKTDRLRKASVSLQGRKRRKAYSWCLRWSLCDGQLLVIVSFLSAQRDTNVHVSRTLPEERINVTVTLSETSITVHRQAFKMMIRIQSSERWRVTLGLGFDFFSWIISIKLVVYYFKKQVSFSDPSICN